MTLRYFFISLASHLFLFLGLFLVSYEQSVVSKKDLIEVELVQRQIVEQDKNSFSQEAPLEKVFLSASDRKVQVQTKAFSVGAFKNVKQTVSRKKSVLGKGLGPAWSQNSPSQNSQKSQTDDFLKDIQEGSETQINTKSYAFYTYYHQIRNRLRPIWNRRIREAYYKALSFHNRNVFSSTRLTKLIVFLDKTGAVSRIEVVESSGSHLVDKAAVEAFYEVAPFPNPPEQIQKQGEIQIEWSFVVEA